MLKCNSLWRAQWRPGGRRGVLLAVALVIRARAGEPETRSCRHRPWKIPRTCYPGLTSGHFYGVGDGLALRPNNRRDPFTFTKTVVQAQTEGNNRRDLQRTRTRTRRFQRDRGEEKNAADLACNLPKRL